MTEPPAKVGAVGCLGRLLVLAFIVGYFFVLRPDTGIDAAAVGDCLQYDAGDDQDRYSRGDCADSATGFEVYERVSSGDDATRVPCTEPGALPRDARHGLRATHGTSAGPMPSEVDSHHDPS